jgi:hypothetical protein
MNPIQKILGKDVSRNRVGDISDGVPLDFIQAEMTNMNTDESNPWKWKKGQKLFQWTRNKYYVIVKVPKYPEIGFTLKEVGE